MTGRAPGWYPDPTGRFGHRWYDGTDWDDDVIGANGQPMIDPYPRADAALRRPSLSARASDERRWSPAPTSSETPVAAVSASSAAPDALPIGIVAAGLLAVVLSLLVLDWASGLGFIDARDGAGEIDGTATDALLRISLQFGSFLVAAAASAAAVAALRTAGSSARISTIGAGVAGFGAVVHTFTIVRLLRSPGASPGPSATSPSSPASRWPSPAVRW